MSWTHVNYEDRCNLRVTAKERDPLQRVFVWPRGYMGEVEDESHPNAISLVERCLQKSQGLEKEEG